MTALKITKANKVLRSSIVLLERKARSGDTGIWRDAARYLSSGTVTWPEVNVARLARIGGSTPTTVWTRSFISNVRPTMPRSAPRAFRQ